MTFQWPRGEDGGPRQLTSIFSDEHLAENLTCILLFYLSAGGERGQNTWVCSLAGVGGVVGGIGGTVPVPPEGWHSS